jgi:hypothetical protein
MAIDALKPWRDFLAKYRKQYPSKSLKECMTGASALWQTRKQKGKGKVDKWGNESIYANSAPQKGKGKFELAVMPTGTFSDYKANNRKGPEKTRQF